MTCEDQELLADFVVEANEHLADIENQFLAVEEGGSNIDVDLVNEIFRGVHSIKGAAGFLGLTTMNDLAHSLENLLNMMRNLELIPTSAIVDTMLRAADSLKGLINDINNSNDMDVSSHIAEMDAIDAALKADKGKASEETPAPEAVVTEESVAVVAEEPLPEVAETPLEPVAPVPAAIPVASEPQAANPANEPKKSPAIEASIRVSVGVLDKLMNLAGELVLSRNQLLQAIASESKNGLETISARLDQVTSELQESIMQTRMQQIGSVFGKFPRLVRDLSSTLGKHIELQIEGKETEVDKTIIEAIGDPLTHLVRNSVDHGVETPAIRVKNGKPEGGNLTLRAFYQAGKVRIEIEDDGAGINPEILKAKAIENGILTPERAEHMSDREAIRLIFAPGFSTAEKVTAVSGRGVGMDVVRTNIAKLGGTVDIESVIGSGTKIVVTLPLTLAIIPSLVVQVANDRFAIPQVNICELVRVRDSEKHLKLGKVKNAEVLRLRGSLLPLVRLEDSLGLASKKNETEEAILDETNTIGATNIIVVETGQTRLGLVVDSLHDSEEIVVKPLGVHSKNCHCLSGATILGDGHVALILDVTGIAMDENISVDEEMVDPDALDPNDEENDDLQAALLFRTHEDDRFAVSMDIVSRIERIRADQVADVGGQAILQYKETTLPLMRLEDVISAKTPDDADRYYVIVFEIRGQEVGLLAPHLDDVRNIRTNFDVVTFKEPGVVGSIVLEEHTVRMVDLFELAELSHPEWFEGDEEVCEDYSPLILLAEDSTFFLHQVQKMFEDKGYRVEPCEDGQIAWDKLESGEYNFDVLVTDIEMPNMNGFELCRNVKDSAKHKSLPVIALTSLAAQSDLQQGIDVGIDDYQIKMDREKLLASLRNFVDHSKERNRSANTGTSRTGSQQRQLAGV